MKILALNLKNIQSIKGEYSIDFSNGALAEAGIFAIVGETGSGKSSILDAICLALYGQTFRHSGKSDQEIISRNEKDAYAEVIFESKSQKFRARWANSFNRNGKINDAKRDIFFLNPESKETENQHSGISKCNEEIVNITGLKFDQFTKSIILVQNNFASFLKAKKAERAEILSKITSTEIYEEISKTVFNTYSEKNQELKNLENQLNNEIISEEEIYLTNEQITNNTLKINDIKIETKKYESQIEILKKIEETESELNTNQIKYQENEKNYSDNLEQINQFQVFEKAKTVEKEAFELKLNHKLIKEYEQKTIELNNTVLEAEQNLKANSLSLEQINADLIQAEKKYQTEKPKIEEAKKIIFKIDEKNNAVKSLKNKEIELNNSKNELEKTISELKNTQNSQTEFINKINLYLEKNKHLSLLNEDINTLRNHYKEIERAEKEIQESNIEQLKENLNKTLSNTKNLKESLNQSLEKQIEQSKLKSLLNTKSENLGKPVEILKEIQELKNAIENINKVQNLKKEHVEKFNKNIKINNLIISQRNILDALKSDTDKLINTLNDKKTIYKLENKIINLEKYRQELEKEKPCPLCGSLHHPFQEHTPNTSISDLEIEIKNTENKLDNLNKESQEITIEIAKNSNEKTSLEENLIQIETNLNETLLKLNNKYQSYIENVSYCNSLLLELEDKYNKSTENEKDIEKNKEQIIELDKKISDINSKIMIEEANANNIGNQIITEELKTKKNQEILSNTFKELNAIILPYQLQKIINSTSSLAEIGKELNSLKLQHDQQIISKQETINQLLETEKNLAIFNSQFETQVKNHHEIIIEIKTLEDDVKELLAQLAQYTIHQSISTLEKEELELMQNMNSKKEIKHQVSENIKLLEKEIDNCQSQIIEIKSKIDYTQKDSLTLENILKSNAIELNLASVEDLIKIIENPNNEHIKDLLDKYKINKSSLENQLEKNKSSLENLNSQITTNDSLEILIEKLDKLKSNQSELEGINGGLNEKLQRYAELKKKNEALLKDINSKKTNFLKWEQLNQLIGQADGSKFKNFAQDFTLSLLVLYANKHLEIIHNRYELFKSDESSEMELLIKDKHFFGETRAINSLSGGETFLVSLALALGLSDIASKKTPIGSLFIDEGFGTLDPESLNNALDALEKLKNHTNRQIGIISHIDELKKRITTQLRLVRTSPEFSKIELVV